jgi:hypothetical protein
MLSRVDQWSPKSAFDNITTNSKDFADPATRQELGTYNCRLALDFAGGLAYIRSQVKPIRHSPKTRATP